MSGIREFELKILSLKKEYRKPLLLWCAFLRAFDYEVFGARHAR